MPTTDLVVVGLGYVGLPLAQQATRSGLTVRGFDIDAAAVDSLNDGRSHIDDLTDADIREMLDAGFTATADPGSIRDAAVVTLCVPTPLSPLGGPDLSALLSAAATVSENLSPGTLVIVESTTYPGSTEEDVLPVLERSGLTAGEQFGLAFSPERVDPGNATFGIKNTPKVVGGLTPECTDRAAAFYGRFVDSVVRARGTREAEMAKLLENTYRHVNIALVNEMAKFSHEMGIDIWNVIECASTKPFGFQAFRPGPGVGGHCIPIDPNYLSYKVHADLGYRFRFVELAQEINAGMPAYIVQRAQSILNGDALPLANSRVLLLGVTYKQDIADARESPAVEIAERFLAAGSDLRFHDPFFEQWTVGSRTLDRVPDVVSAVAEADLVVLLQAHAAYADGTITNGAKRLFDTRGRLSGQGVAQL
ncbi:nucleotide sugar dehydrogenase [Propionibacteriaceae bacterium ES.041]|uniref:nucleotide sugar dehydrogenase n=1 Tax=Enemella evansiae TaxID=2016499 RepID=UPI000B973353|nr:nucleotide sugar dehydrogenase [Enemella evansiae]OYN99732.1 UDP-N-acetyl-D-glucosamine dehydrogenase [Enemella evansiae]OYO04645.1 UDP-N-acetyl-D-glucosamine dehydrogenase [Enemella evansiae]PFG66019.1 nucleotide sugar dehydrogenase [Propionibacteriaceae bacterium ES.041]TDO85326.1 nucleotide sugar dehydrogenase [Enemella evansiae]